MLFVSLGEISFLQCVSRIKMSCEHPADFPENCNLCGANTSGASRDKENSGMSDWGTFCSTDVP